jgi:cell division protein FtsL
MIRKKFKKREIGLVIFCTIVVIFILSFYIWHQTESIRLGYKTGELEEKIQNLEKEVEKLETYKSRLLSLQRVEKIAEKELGLVPPEEHQILYISFGK